MSRYIQGQLDWPKFLSDLQQYQNMQGLTNKTLAKRLHISDSALTRYFQAKRQPTCEVFVFAVLLMGRELRDYVRDMPQAS